MDATSVSLLDRLRRQADEPSWQQFVAIYQPWLRGWLLAHFLQSAEVEHAMQEVLAVVSKTAVTAAGVADLQKALSRTQVLSDFTPAAHGKDKAAR